MTVTFVKIDDLSTGFVDFYTIRLGNNQLTEFELFDEKDFPDHEEEIQIIYNVIEAMKTIGARIRYFKTNEGPADALPRVSEEIMDANTVDFGIRLYCVRLTDKLVILVNGDIKTKIDPSLCDNVSSHFRRTFKIASKLDRLLKEGEINFQEPGCLDNLEIDI